MSVLWSAVGLNSFILAYLYYMEKKLDVPGIRHSESKVWYICRWSVMKQEGAELCQAQSAKHKLFGSNGAIFFGLNCWWLNCWIVELFICWTVELLNFWIVKLLNCWIVKLLNCWIVELLNRWIVELLKNGTVKLLNCWIVEWLNCGSVEMLNCWKMELLNCWFVD